MPGKRRREPANTTGRIPFVWVEDHDTGHRYDVPQNAVRPGMTPVDGYDLNWGRTARRTKHFVGKGGGRATPEQPAGDVDAAQTAAPEQAPKAPAAKPVTRLPKSSASN